MHPDDKSGLYPDEDEYDECGLEVVSWGTLGALAVIAVALLLAAAVFLP